MSFEDVQCAKLERSADAENGRQGLGEAFLGGCQCLLCRTFPVRLVNTFDGLLPSSAKEKLYFNTDVLDYRL